eukprot:CAMPEP_0204338022 /NCGR_PEP_ID=MMETSP0469-20131031/20765_1 /ASSEMBLY_ACC=CAM_ASM_000384 /TAXON_ID=2969 /ORGANISM="Oxyrrhis marina" /LENGTH=125 /DNA_ID=CAMNT_0051322141 /DNA_START=245 /DNA_END=618 /DNA_ORIENTATION=+
MQLLRMIPWSELWDCVGCGGCGGLLTLSRRGRPPFSARAARRRIFRSSRKFRSSCATSGSMVTWPLMFCSAALPSSCSGLAWASCFAAASFLLRCTLSSQESSAQSRAVVVSVDDVPSKLDRPSA